MEKIKINFAEMEEKLRRADYSYILQISEQDKISDLPAGEKFKLMTDRARVYVNIGDFNSAREILNTMIYECMDKRLYRELGVAYVMYAVLELETGNDQKVATYLNKAIKMKPNFSFDEQLLFKLASIKYAMKTGNLATCLDDINDTLREVKVASVVPELEVTKSEFVSWLEFYRLYVLVEMQEGKDFQGTENALVTFTKNITNHELKWRTLFDLAELDYRYGKLESALDQVKSAISIVEIIAQGLPKNLIEIYLTYEKRRKLYDLYQLLRTFTAANTQNFSMDILNKFNMIFEIIKRINSTHNISTVLSVILDTMLYFCKAFRGFLVIYDKGEESVNIIRCRLGSSFSEQEQESINQITELAINSNDEVYFNGKDSAAFSKEIARQFQNGSFLAIPLTAKGKKLGVIYLDNKYIPAAFSESSLKFAKMLAEQASLAIENAILLSRSVRDKLTGLYNSSHIEDVLTQEINRAKRDEKSMSILFAEIDNFHSISSQMGYKQMSSLLCKVGDAILKSIRNYDAVGINAGSLETKVARFSPSQFEIVIPNSDKLVAEGVASRLVERISKQPFKIGNQVVTLTSSVGVATYPEDGDDVHELLLKCDEALYKAKKAGGNKYAFPSDISKAIKKQEGQSPQQILSERGKLAVAIINKLIEDDSLDKTINQVLNLIVRAFQADKGFILLLDNENQVKFKMLYNIADEEFDINASSDKQRTPFEVVKEVVSLRTLRFYPEFEVEQGVEKRLVSVLAHPIKANGMLKGVVYLERSLDKQVFSEDEIVTFKYLIRKIEKPMEKIFTAKELQEKVSVLQEQVKSGLKELSTKYSKITHEIIGNSPKMQQLFSMIETVSKVDYSVIIQGETGVGKELVAKSIHFSSNRKDRPFIPINCAAISETLLESELFGYVKGAFTGASQDKPGIFEVADGGTLLLDEIEEMSESMQKKLLRVLEERKIRRVGSNDLVSVNVRLLAATNENIKGLVEQNKFRSDLYYRMGTFTVEVPALRERIEDLPMLIEKFLEDVSKETGIPKKKMSEKAIRSMMKYDWPGNVRELKNEIKRLAITTAQDVITDQDLPSSLQKGEMYPELLGDDGYLSEKLEKFEKVIILNALKTHNNNIQKTAHSLGVDRSTLWRKLKKFNIEVEE